MTDQQGSDEIDLAALDDGELVKQMHDDLYDGLADEIVEGTMILLDRGWSPDRTLNDALVEGMRIVGIDFRDGILFVPEVLLAANAMKAGMEILRPLLAETGAESIGKIVIGTVKGDIHDIGKNLVAMMLEGAGFEVVDLGINTDVDKFLAALALHKPDILGMSALLTTTMPYMKVVIDTLAEKGLRDTYIVLVGGAPLNEEFGAAIGADAYCRDAAVAAETAKELVSARRKLPRRTGRTFGGVIVTESVADGGACAAGATPLVTKPLVIGCGALASELRAVLVAAGLDEAVEVRYLPAHFHNRPERIVPALEEALAGESGRRVLVAYADCGTGGALDRFVAERPDTARLPGAHCYELFAGADVFAALHDAEPGTFYLTDYLARHFDPLVWQGLGLDRHPELRDAYFANYRRVVLLSQSDDPSVVDAGRAAAEQLGLEFEHRHVGRSGLAEAVGVVVSRRAA